MLAYDETLLREPNLLIPGRKPVGPVRVDWSHVMSRNLFAAFVRPDLTKNTGGGSVKRNDFYIPTGSDEGYYSDPPPPGPITYAARVKFNNFNAPTFEGHALGQHPGDAGNNGAVVLSSRSATPVSSPTLTATELHFAGGLMRIWVGRDADEIANGIAHPTVITTGTWYDIAAVFPNSVTDLVVYLDGVAGNTVYDTAGAYNTSWGGDNLYLGHHPSWPIDGNDNADMDIAYAYAWSGEKSAEFLDRVRRDPYAHLVPA